MIKRIYVAGGSTERLSVVRPMLDALRGAGHIITHDWTTCEGYDRPHSAVELVAWAASDFAGVRGADLVWVMVPEEKSEGAATELGIALALNRFVAVSGPHARRNIFGRLAHIIMGQRADALAWILDQS